MEKIDQVLGAIDSFVWGVPLMVMILGCGLWLTWKVKLLQVTKLGKALKYMVKNEENGVGEVSSFGALCTALSATIGTGNIVGVATAIAAGGPGALFWMVIAAFFGMATKYSEGLLAIKYRKVKDDGTILGGPFMYIEQGMGKKWKPLAVFFAISGCLVGLLGIGTMTQISGITSAAQSFFDASYAGTLFMIGDTAITLTTVITGTIVTVLAALVIIGGIKRISKVASIVVPFMAIAYFVLGIFVIILNVTSIPAAVVTIVSCAFNPQAVLGGGLGITMVLAMRNGVARGIFSNEAGIGSAPIAAAAAQTKDPVRQGLISMTGTFIDTIIICTITGLAIVMTGAWDIGLVGVNITMYAFANALPLPEVITSFLLMVCLMFFAFTTILGWDYYSERCVDYLFGGSKKAIHIFRWLYIAFIAIGPYMTVSAVWTIADIVNALMAIPNVIALLALSNVVAKETSDYFANKEDEGMLKGKNI